MTAPARAAVTAQLGPLAPLLVPSLDTLSTIRNAGDVDSRYFQKSTNWALFTHDIIHVTDRIDVTLGLRYTHERKRFSADLNNDNAVCSALQARNPGTNRSEEHTSELQSLMRISYAVFCLKKKKKNWR